MSFPWLDDRRDLPQVARLSDDVEYRQAARGIVLVEAGADPRRLSEETTQLIETMSHDRRVVGIVAALNWRASHPEITRSLSTLCAEPAVVGVRLSVAADGLSRTESLQFGAVARDIVSGGLCLDVLTDSLHAFTALFAGGLDRPAVIDHLGSPPIEAGFYTGRAKEWSEALHRTASETGWSMKLSGLAPRLRPGASVTDLRPWIETALTELTTKRLLVGSDLPVSQMPDGSWFDFLSALLDDDFDEDLAWRTAQGFYGVCSP
jgi:L-fuconolactonase